VEERETRVRTAVRRWSEQLMDVGGRNALLHYRDLKVGTLDLAMADNTAVSVLLTGRTVPLGRLFPEPAIRNDVLKRARAIRNKARELREERGIETCFLTFGQATWTNPKGGATPAAPVLLRPAQLRARGAAEEEFELTVAPDAELNPVLVHVLATDFDVRVDAEQIADLPSPEEVYERLVKETAERVRGFAIRPRMVLGTFSYAKLPMVSDLAGAEEELAAHDVVAAIAGDRDAQAALRVPAQVDPSAPDTTPPDAEFVVLDADSSQHLAINAVLAGQHAVVKGPPGTGKSQTIANLITSLVAAGKRVLFVAEKRAAITAVTDRLARRGLGQLVMDVHEGTAGRRRLAAELKSVYDSAARVALPDLTGLHETLVDRRGRLSGYAAALHERRDPWGVTAFEAKSALLSLPPAGPFRLRGPALAVVDGVAARRVRELLREYAALGGLAPPSSPWHESTVHSGAEAQEAWLASGRLASGATAAAAVVDRALASVGLAPPGTLAQMRAARSLVDGVAATLSAFDPAVFSVVSEELVAACAPAEWRQARGVHIGWWRRRALRRQASALWRGSGAGLFRGGAAPSGLRSEATREDGALKAPTPRERSERQFTALSAALEQRSRWPGSGPPRVPAEWSAARSAHEAVEADVAVLARVLPTVDFAALPLLDLAAFAQRLAADDRTLRRQPRRLEIAAELDRLGLTPLLAGLRGRSDAEAIAAFDACWYASIVEQIAFADPRIGEFDGATHDRTVTDYRAADTAHVDSSARRVLRAVAAHIVAARDEYPDEDRLVEHQANLKRRHLPMRQLFAAAPHILTALKPCWAMSPLVVSQLLPTAGRYFDVVIFDEASQVTPADAVPAILRGRQVVVAGDENQLPPTVFFTAADTDGDNAVGLTDEGAIDLALTRGYESVLDVLSALLPRYLLRWHYRSRDERLIAFSNAWIYDRGLVTFPGASGAGRLSHVLVPHKLGEDASESGSAEVSRVVELVLDHAARRPEESLGVIAMGITHAERIDVALRRALAKRPELHGFFAESAGGGYGAAEPFFVKNLERVQGDERDAIILSVGYGKTADGRLLYRFGPLLTAGGERRLNVAVTRARSRMTVVSSFSATDLEPGRTNARGVALLREYLRYAASGGSVVGGPAVNEAPAVLDAFERDVCDRLTAAGVPVLARHGVVGQHIEFVVSHPERPDELVLAIEADGPGYRAAGTVRDRDRLRPAQLVRLGWRYHRIWSTDWFADPAAEVARAVVAYRAAVAEADEAAGVAGAVAAVAEAPAPAEASAADEASAAAGASAGASAADEAAVADEAGDGPAPAQTGNGRGPRPPVQAGLPIGAYEQADLVALIRWIESDTLLRTEEEVLDEVVRELGFARRGPRIRAVVTPAITAARA
jgi:hypothetical protein